MAYSCLTGVGSTLVCAESTLKFSSSQAWKITRIAGLGRSVPVIDDSYLGITAGAPKQYCFGALHELEPLEVACLLDVDDTDVFPDAATSDGSVPVPLGSVSTGVPTATEDDFTLTMPTAPGANATTLNFSGAIVRDSGFELVNNDRLRTTFTIQPDGKTFTWDSNDS